MAAVTTSPPPPHHTASPTASPIRRKPVQLHDLSPPERFSWEEDRKPLPTIPDAESPRLRNAPVSPVRVNFQAEDWAQPSNANIESNGQVEGHAQRAVRQEERDLPRTPDAPTPPPHTPGYDQDRQRTLTHRPHETHVAQGVDKPLPAVVPISSGPFHEEPHTLSPQTAPDSAFSPVHAEIPGILRRKASKTEDPNRHSRETDASTSTGQQHASTESSATTSASSISGIEASDSQDLSGDGSPESSLVEESGLSGNQPVPQLQYHHQAFLPRTASAPIHDRAQSQSDLPETAANIGRHLTPTNYIRRSSLPRPQSAYSLYSDGRGRSPGAHHRAPSSQSRKSPETRPSSYAELLNIPYPQHAPAPLAFDNSQLRNAVGSNASLLSAQKTLEMYRQNVKKTNDYSIQYSFAVFLISTAQEQGFSPIETKTPKSPKSARELDSPYVEGNVSSPNDLVREARAILQKLSNNGYPFAQYYLADGYASGLFSKGKEDYNSAFPLFVLAAKHGHAESAYRTALCYEFGWGCRKDPAKAVQFLRTAAAKRHPGAMLRLGTACLSGDLGEKRYREGVKWLKLATESADTIYNAAPYQLGILYETGYGDDVFQDESYAAELFTQAADLGHAEASYRMGDAYEHGKLNCPRDPALSVHFYTGAAERGHAAAMMGLCAWYMVGAEPILEKDENEAYEWARRSAELGYVKAQYAVGYFTEMGIGCRRDILEANVWYVKAADAGDDRARQRLAAIRVAVSGGKPMEVASPRDPKMKKGGSAVEAKDDKECVVM